MTLYRFFTDLTAPLITLYLRFRRAKGREDKQRFQERLGLASARRPPGHLVWCHAASVGEAMSVLALLKALRRQYPHWHVLLTTGTVTSAAMVKDRLPEGVVHQYVPVDRWSYVDRFLDHWKPNLALWVESELWPNMLGALVERHIPAALLNGRMSERSYRRWRLIPGGARRVMNAFSLGLAQTGVEANRFASLGLRDVRSIGNLKYAAAHLPCDEQELVRLRGLVGVRPVWLVASTHQGEEEIAIKAHKALSIKHPDLLTIIVPRHPERGNEIAELLAKTRLTLARRSANEELSPSIAVYLADTMGEMGLFYRLCSLVCLAGSFNWGGHNPIEPAQLGCAVVFGPRMDNFLVMADDMLGHRAALQVLDVEELIEVTGRLLDTPNEKQILIDAAKLWAAAKHAVLDETLKMLAPLINDAEKKVQ